MDIRQKKVPFEFDGKSFELTCNMNVLADVQEAYGGEIASALSGTSTLKSLLTFLTAMLNDYADERGWEWYTVRGVGRKLNPKSMGATLNTVMELVADAVKSEDEEKN
ncbi:MAG: hypothetical protein RSB39_07380 [Oscillospiraceae bacterium]